MTTRAIAISATVVIPGHVPSANEVLRMHHMQRHRLNQAMTLRGAAALLAGSARVEAGWPRPVKEPAVVRWLTIVVRRYSATGQQLDDDNPYVKPLRDALEGHLIYLDSPAYSQLAAPVRLERVDSPFLEQTVITVHLADPRT